MVEENSIHADVKVLLDRFYSETVDKEINNQTLNKLESLKSEALELIKNHLLYEAMDSISRDIISRVNAENLYETKEELLFSVISAIRENTEIKNVLNYLLKYSNSVELYENSNVFDLYFSINSKIKVNEKEKEINLHIGTIRFNKENKILESWLGYKDNPIFITSVANKTSNDYERQLKGFVNWISEEIKKIANKLYD